MEILITLFAFAIALLLLNFTALPVFIGLENSLQIYSYTTADGQFTIEELPEKGKGFAHVKQQFDLYKWENGKTELQLFRTFKKNYFMVWKWWEYRSHERWQMEYQAKLPKEK